MSDDIDHDEWVGTDRDAPADADEWEACTAIDYLHGPLRSGAEADTGLRKWQLFEAACCRHVWHLLPAPASRAAVEAAEAFADGRVTAGKLEAALVAADAAWRPLYDPDRPEFDHPPEMYAGMAAARLGPDVEGEPYLSEDAESWYEAVLAAVAAEAARAAGSHDALWAGRVRGNRALAALFRCVMGNPYRPVTFASEWQTSAAVALARSAYESRDFAGLPVLADALEEAGCDDEHVLAHLRGPGPHARGCWVVDLVLGHRPPPVFEAAD